MAKTKATRKSTRKGARGDATPEGTTPGWLVVLTGLVLLAVEVAFLPGAASPFRVIKATLAVGGLAVVVGLGITVALARGGLRLPRGPLVPVVASYPLLLAVSAIWSTSPARALLAAATATVWAAAALWFATFPDVQRRRLIGWAAVGAGLSAAVAVLQAVGVDVVSVPLSETGARAGIVGLAGNSSDLAMGCLLILPLVLAVDIAWRPAWLRLIVPTLLATAAVLSRTMTGVAALVLMAVVWTLMLRSRRRRRTVVAAAAVLLVIAAASGAGQRAVWVMKRAAEGDLYSALSARTEGWTAAVQMVTSHPVLGVGGDHYTRAFYPSRIAWLEEHPTPHRRGELATHFQWAHNDPLQLVAELGVLGAAWLMALLAALYLHHRRGDPLAPLAVAAVGPFALLHYPGHLALGLVPMVLVLAELISRQGVTEVAIRRRVVGVAGAVAALALAAVVARWQVQRLRFTSWMGLSQQLMTVAQQLDPAERDRILVMVERQAEQRLADQPAQAARLWRLVGWARLERGAAAAAEEAFRTSWALAPHEDAEMGVGLALLARGLRGDAWIHLRRVTRTNPALLDMVPDPELRVAIRQSLEEPAR